MAKGAHDNLRLVTLSNVCNFQAPKLCSFRPALTPGLAAPILGDVVPQITPLSTRDGINSTRCSTSLLRCFVGKISYHTLQSKIEQNGLVGACNRTI